MAKRRISKHLLKQINKEIRSYQGMGLGANTIDPKYLKRGTLKNLIQKNSRGAKRTPKGQIKKKDLPRVSENILVDLRRMWEKKPHIQKRLRSYKKKKFNKKLKQLKKAGVLTYEGWWGV